MTRLVVTTDADADFTDVVAYLQREAGARVAAHYSRRFNLGACFPIELNQRRQCEEPQPGDEAIHAALDCFAPLAMTRISE